MNYRTQILLVIAFLATTATAVAQKPKASINHLALFVVNCKTTTTFYKDIIGLDTIPEPFHDGKHTWFRIGPKQSLHIIEGATEKKEYYKNNHICFSVESVEAFSAKLKKNNITFEDLTGKQNVFSSRIDGVKQLWLRDPDGYWVEINDAKE